jgi:hypothetical protein
MELLAIAETHAARAIFHLAIAHRPNPRRRRIRMPRKRERRYRRPRRFVEYQEAQGRTIESLRFWHSPAEAQAITVHFTDGTHIHIGIEPLLKVQAEAGQLGDGDLAISKTYPAVVGSPVD